MTAISGKSAVVDISIIMTIDLSSSMLAEDFQPQNRVEVAKDRMKQFISGRTQDQIGLVSFSGEALTPHGDKLDAVAIVRGGADAPALDLWTRNINEIGLQSRLSDALATAARATLAL